MKIYKIIFFLNFDKNCKIIYDFALINIKNYNKI